MAYRLLADLLVAFHLCFVLFVVLGGLCALRWPRAVWLHLPAALWGAGIEFVSGICPLTPIESRLRHLGGEAGYSGGFVEHYLLPALYPAGLTPNIQLVLGTFVVVLNAVVYALVWRRWRRRRPAAQSSAMSSPRDNRRRLSAFWDGSRDYYRQAAAANPEASPERRLLLGYLQAGQRVVDLGCGSCENALWIPPGCRYIGFDVSTAALVLAGEWGRPGMRVRGDGETLPFASDSVDAVLSTYALEHFHEPGRTLLEAARVVRPGGLLLLVGSAWDLPYEMPPSLDPRRRPGVAARRLARQLLSALDGRHRFDTVPEPRVLTEGYVPDADAVHVAQSHQMVRFLAAAGLAIVEHRTLPHRPDPGGLRGALRRGLRLLPLWRHGWGNTLIVARRGPVLRAPDYRLLPL